MKTNKPMLQKALELIEFTVHENQIIDNFGPHVLQLKKQAKPKNPDHKIVAKSTWWQCANKLKELADDKPPPLQLRSSNLLQPPNTHKPWVRTREGMTMAWVSGTNQGYLYLSVQGKFPTSIHNWVFYFQIAFLILTKITCKK